jgi:hypothetical protein
MNHSTIFYGLLLSVLACAPLCAQTRTSADYGLSTETLDTGGMTLGSADYHIHAASGEMAGLSNATTSPDLTIKFGYVGQLYDLAGLHVSANATTVSEAATLQLEAKFLADDSTVLPLAPSAVFWSIGSGPIVSIATSGLMTAGAVYTNTGAVAVGAVQGFTATFALTVINLSDDDFGLYANDGLPDTWQVQYFGIDNPLAAPTAEPLHDGQSNLLKFLTGYAPTSLGSKFTTTGTAFSDGIFHLSLSQVLPGTRYIFQRSTDLQSWTTIETLEPVTLVQPFVKSLPSIGDKSFFRVVIEPGSL